MHVCRLLGVPDIHVSGVVGRAERSSPGESSESISTGGAAAEGDDVSVRSGAEFVDNLHPVRLVLRQRGNRDIARSVQRVTRR